MEPERILDEQWLLDNADVAGVVEIPAAVLREIRATIDKLRNEPMTTRNQPMITMLLSGLSWSVGHIIGLGQDPGYAQEVLYKVWQKLDPAGFKSGGGFEALKRALE